mmetsp:Transcript_71231/g.230631  ORF Transcript_71231/g.230631 Transcript_71231/m.230631 type:complete len:228 (+) Transcript_71231:335-1018(+)
MPRMFSTRGELSKPCQIPCRELYCWPRPLAPMPWGVQRRFDSVQRGFSRLQGPTSSAARVPSKLVITACWTVPVSVASCLLRNGWNGVRPKEAGLDDLSVICTHRFAAEMPIPAAPFVRNAVVKAAAAADPSFTWGQCSAVAPSGTATTAGGLIRTRNFVSCCLALQLTHLRVEVLLHHELLELCCHGCLLHLQLLLKGQLIRDHRRLVVLDRGRGRGLRLLGQRWR